MNVLAIDIGGTHVKILATGQDEPRRFVSGPTLTPKQMVAGVKKLARNWKYDVVSMGYPGSFAGIAEPRPWLGGFCLWEKAGDRRTTRRAKGPKRKRRKTSKPKMPAAPKSGAIAKAS